ncbi:class I SAM-dependent methyltransferase [Catenuloplanes atrovinosus]|uniref:SAM-dependent methyltransferase n=1 Tax=Catenuloplanes atrovinosus TaxID=137266 RepID=A0AAE4C8H9_9ACTN|nr:class I SAM-dependent methyltransferase [Catenuloplanes atrovinosus]MDR7274993.1 SAM-dependent methyltransferase [Catenuloplanes atrovinosus]
MIGDAFGELLGEVWAAGAVAGRVEEVVERDDGLISRGDAARYLSGPESWPACETAVLARAHGRILDIGCGAGRHLAALRERGADASGIDPSPGAVAVCRARGLAAEVGDLDRLPPGPYDTLLLLGGNLALLGSPADAARRLAALAAVAAPGALLLGSNIDPHHTGDPRHTGYHDRNVRHGRPAGQLRLRVRHGETVTEWTDYWLAGVSELEKVAAASPWRLESVDGHPFYAAVLTRASA